MTVYEQLVEEIVNNKRKDVATIRSYFSSRGFKILGKSSRISPPADLRISISGDQGITLEILKGVISVNNLSYKTEVIEAGVGKEYKSGKYCTYKLYNDIDDPIYIVDSLVLNQKAGRKSLTPDALGLSGWSGSYLELYMETKNHINKSNAIKNEVKEYMIFLLDIIMDDMHVDNNLEPNDVFIIDKNLETENEFSEVNKQTKEIILNDFGEVVTALFFGKLQDEVISFPKSSNEKLVDAYVGQYNISVKKAGGAAPSLTGILKSEIFTEFEPNPDEVDSIETLLLAKNNSVFHGYLKIAKKFNIIAWQELNKIVGKLDLNKTTKVLQQQMHDALDLLYESGELESVLTNFYNKIGNSADNIHLYDPEGPHKDVRFGYLQSPLTYSLIRNLNSNTKLVETLNNIVNKIDVKQIYLKNKKNHIEFKIKDFDRGQFVFAAANISKNNPLNSKLAFKMK